MPISMSCELSDFFLSLFTLLTDVYKLVFLNSIECSEAPEIHYET